jgi:hypothetical protein
MQSENAGQSSPLEDIGVFLAPGVDGCERTAQAISYALDKLPGRDQWCVEFGAGWDEYGSTTARLIKQAGYSAVLIEGSPANFQKLEKIHGGNPRITLKNCFVGFDDRTGLDGILSGTPVPEQFDFLSVDIDGNDYHAWAAIKRYHPKLVMVEFNPTIPLEVAYVQPCDPAINHGNSLAALVELGRQKGYQLISVIGVNAIFVAEEFYPLFGLADNRPGALWTKRDCVTYLFSGYDGRIFLAGAQKLPWHCNIPIRAGRMQVLAGGLQKYRFTRWDKRIHDLTTEPFALLKRAAGKLFGRRSA